MSLLGTTQIRATVATKPSASLADHRDHRRHPQAGPTLFTDAACGAIGVLRSRFAPPTETPRSPTASQAGRAADRYHAESNVVSLTGTALNLNDGVYRPVASLTGTALDLNEGSKAHALLDGATLKSELQRLFATHRLSEQQIARIEPTGPTRSGRRPDDKLREIRDMHTRFKRRSFRI